MQNKYYNNYSMLHTFKSTETQNNKMEDVHTYPFSIMTYIHNTFMNNTTILIKIHA